MPAVREKSGLQVQAEAGGAAVRGLGEFDLAATLDCGQAFRWATEDDGAWRGVACGRVLRVRQRDDGVLLFEDTPLAEFEQIWRRYFDLDRDYAAIRAAISGHPVLREVSAFAGGIRVLSQDPWETLCSFIISQNNNIPRIKGIIARLCESFGDPLPGGEYAFPPPERLAPLGVADLAPLRSGFRAKYILDAARRVSSGEVELDPLRTLPLADARQSLTRIMGVGPKVADCALLFGCGRIECFPMDVWIKRAMKQLFGGELPACARPYAGIVQQMIFHYARMTRLNI